MKIFLQEYLIFGLSLELLIGIAKNDAQSCYEIAKYFLNRGLRFSTIEAQM